MKFVVFASGLDAPSPGLLTPDGVVPIGDLVAGDSPQAQIEDLINRFEALRPRLESLSKAADALSLDVVRLLPPVPRPGKMLCTTAVFSPGAALDRQQLLMTLKSAESVIGPDDTIVLPGVDRAWQFVPQAGLALVLRGPARRIPVDRWQSVVFGVTCAVDVMARGDQQFGRDFWLAKADTLGPLGPCIVTLDEAPDPNAMRVRSWHNDAPAQDFGVSDASHSLAEQVEFATTIMTLHTGDVLVCGTSPLGQRPLADGDSVRVEIDGVGSLRLGVGCATLEGAASRGRVA